ncbi:prolyl oligopeptidase family serine peptidase [Uliginosibacterium sp. 31-16]|uniref:alpha/beta hydrolase family protein n=1 Tax=Uliginosibacterium sp. 31-16 TaxID=3068315 RepID=UPI00273D9FB3|nr:prolyl oligopeptidase family serine peptidase [Uliginosibacterium sp. 31-16]MDP5239067.1 prolyl oligopeptidase family serine peptidase [Uliginosibacterium sp. 31-16]
MSLLKPIFASLLLLTSLPGFAEVCDAEDFTQKVSGASQCLLMRRFGSPTPDTLVVWLHGDVSSGGPANYHFPYAEKLAQEPFASKILSVALVRPGYPDGSGAASGVAETSSGRSDHYTQENLTEVGTAIERLRAKYKPARLMVVSHSGGAATTATLIGMMPGLIDTAVLVSCPCDTVAWRAGRRAWSKSENPLNWTGKVPASTRVIALTGDKDDNTAPALAQAYVAALQVRQIDARFELLPGENHNTAFRPASVFPVLQKLLSEK